MSAIAATTSVKIPVIDFAPFLQGDAVGKQQVAQEIYHACDNMGFLYLRNHGIEKELVDRVFAHSKIFFDLPLTVKQGVSWSSEFTNRGYIGIKRERLNPERPGDAKECFNVGSEAAEATAADPDNPAMTLNQWTNHDPAFRSTVMEFFAACNDTANQVFRAFALALQLPESFIVDRHRKQENVLRLLHYPPMLEAFEPEQIRAGEHSDYGSVTLLFQDDVGGLEVKTATGDWIEAPYIADTVLVNTGDLMQRWSNDVFRSTKHRVGIPTGDRVHQHRYSIAYFCQPDHDAEIACIDSCQGPAHPPLYPPILAGEYLLSLLQATY